MRNGVGRAIGDFSLIKNGDRICVGLSGGKDSQTMLLLLHELQRRAPVEYQLIPVTVDAGFDQFDTESIAALAASLGLSLHVEKVDHAALIDAKLRPGSSYCSFCARLKRGALYGAARRLGCNLLALGHHRDDFIETLLMNQFFIGTIKAMSPKMLCDTGDITVIRPMVYLAEDDIISFVQQAGVRTVSCSCPVAGDPDQQRKRMKQLLKRLEKDIPQVKNSLLAALGNVQPRHLLDNRLKKEEESMRIGHGYDVHRLVEERKLIMGGVDIPYEKGLLGHSDADVLLHAIADAILGALAMGDIGKHFPDTDPAFKGADSMKLLAHVVGLAKGKGYIVGNMDATIIAQKPKMAPHIQAMRVNIASVCGVEIDRINVKATTEEGLGFSGRGEGISAHAVVLMEKAT